jgi:hypothetical protein
MVLSDESILSWVVEWIKFVSPVAREVEPFNGCLWTKIGATQYISLVVISVRVQVQKGIPERSPICLVVKNAARQHIWVRSRYCIHRVGSSSRISHRLVIVSV